MNEQELQDRAVKIYQFKDQPHKYIYKVMVRVPHPTNMFAFPTSTIKYYLLDGADAIEMKIDQVLECDDGGTKIIELDGVELTIPHNSPSYGCGFTLSYGTEQLVVV
jgi:hypothetical protein